MKYCPYCGAVLPGSAVSFCSECGRAVNDSAADSRSREEMPSKATIPFKSGKRPSGSYRSDKRPPRGSSHTQMKRRPVDKRMQKAPVRPGSNMKRHKTPERATANPSPMDIDYDGYYDDVPTADNGQSKKESRPELIQRVALIAAGTLLIVILSIIIMYVL